MFLNVCENPTEDLVIQIDVINIIIHHWMYPLDFNYSVLKGHEGTFLGRVKKASQEVPHHFQLKRPDESNSVNSQLFSLLLFHTLS